MTTRKKPDTHMLALEERLRTQQEAEPEMRARASAVASDLATHAYQQLRQEVLELTETYGGALQIASSFAQPANNRLSRAPAAEALYVSRGRARYEHRRSAGSELRHICRRVHSAVAPRARYAPAEYGDRAPRTPPCT
jgi:hypothetical protein